MIDSGFRLRVLVSELRSYGFGRFAPDVESSLRG